MKQNWLQGKTIIITGASSGIGKELTKLFIMKNNCHVIGIARSEQKMKQLITELGEHSKNFEYRLFDVGDCDNWIEFAKSIDKPVHLLINNAGIMHNFDNFLNIDLSEGKKVIDTNFYSVVYGCNTFLPLIEPNGGVVNICSSDALLAVCGTSYYAASKGAVKSFTQSLVGEFPNNYIACVFPGFTATDIFRNMKFSAPVASSFKKFVSPSSKTAWAIYKSILKKKKYTVVGKDAKLFYALSKTKLGGGEKLINGVLQNSKTNLFSTIKYKR